MNHEQKRKPLHEKPLVNSHYQFYFYYPSHDSLEGESSKLFHSIQLTSVERFSLLLNYY